ncbi:hypothetical protein JG688_00002971 [Phytophthora aleatoria]|uniref:Regulator of chromosome condensation (RCC1)-like protein n=1 Tax=Phytophthora aleatoria TaxID=2496075 RepID=A0A8J5MIH4_9STRA|nr:hypothetical protein JG688_00002971 [Phytophthora aleatoria]
MTPTTAFEQRDALVVSATFLRTAFGGASSAYSLWLGQPCTSVVVVHLLLPSDAIGSVRLSSDRLCFTPDTFAQPQIVRVEALENRQQWSVITHRLYSLDRNYDRVVTPNVVVQTEVTPLECPLLTFGGLTTKRKAATTDSSTRLDILAALPKDTTNEAAEGGAAADASWCMSHLASGYHFSVAAVVQPKGTTLLSWGLNTNGELGNGTMTSSPTPQQVITLPLQLQREPLTVAHVSCGKHHVAVITGQARLFTWGCNKYGQLGLGDFSPRTQPHEVYFALATLSSHRRALRVVHTVQRAGNNVTHVAWKAYTWGLNLRDNNALVGSDASPQVIDLPEKERVRRISCGWTHTNIVTYISADEASASGQGANFDRKIERERINQRKAEVARWRAFVTAAISSTSRETRRGDREQKFPIQKAVKTTKNVKSTAKGIAEQTEAVQEIEASLEKLSVSYSNQAMEDAVRNVAQECKKQT